MRSAAGTRRRAMEAKPNPTFSGRVALVTGASQGIGEAIAFELAKEGPLVFLVDIQREKLEAVAEKIVRNGGRASVQPADVSRFDQASDVVEGIVRENKGP